MASLNGLIIEGSFHGKVTLSHAKGQVRFSGVYQNGRAEGPGWVFPSDWERTGFVHLFFSAGEIVPYPVFWIHPDATQVYAGRINGTYLENARKVTDVKVGQFNCVKFLVETKRSEAVSEQETDKVKLPVIIKTSSAHGLLFVRSSKTLVFNRVAKTGSQSITELLVQLESKTGIKPVIAVQDVEYLLESHDEVAKFVAQVDQETIPSAYVKHFNFVNFLQYGALNSPLYINMVRHPVERVSVTPTVL